MTIEYKGVIIMNKQKRSAIAEAKTKLSDARDCIMDVKMDEEGCIDSYPENLQNTETYEVMCSAVDALDEAIDSIEDAIESLDEIS